MEITNLEKKRIELDVIEEVANFLHQRINELRSIRNSYLFVLEYDENSEKNDSKEIDLQKKRTAELNVEKNCFEVIKDIVENLI